MNELVLQLLHLSPLISHAVGLLFCHSPNHLSKAHAPSYAPLNLSLRMRTHRFRQELCLIICVIYEDFFMHLGFFNLGFSSVNNSLKSCGQGYLNFLWKAQPPHSWKVVQKQCTAVIIVLRTRTGTWAESGRVKGLLEEHVEKVIQPRNISFVTKSTEQT